MRGPEIDELDRISRELVTAMREIPGSADIENSLEKSKPELRVNVDRQRASDLGIPVSMVASTMQAGVVGNVATTIQDSIGDNHDVRVRLRADQRRFADDLERLSVPTDKDDDNGDKILRPLSEVATVYPGTGPSSIRRRDLVREVRVSANTDGRPLQELSNDINAAAAKLNLPPGYDIVAGGDTEELEIMFRNMFQALMLAVIFIYLILASQFGSFTHPLAIMLSLPLSLVGVAVMLYFTHDTLNIMSMIGLIMLMGLVTKNAILLVDFTNQARREGMPRHSGPAAGRHDPPAADRHDDAGDDLRHAAAGVCHRRRRRDARADGARGHRRVDYLDAALAARRAGRLHVPRRFPAVDAVELDEMVPARRARHRPGVVRVES